MIRSNRSWSPDETVNDIPVSIQNSRIKLIKRETHKETLLSQAIH
jgi:hypothetical protein